MIAEDRRTLRDVKQYCEPNLIWSGLITPTLFDDRVERKQRYTARLSGGGAFCAKVLAGKHRYEASLSQIFKPCHGRCAARLGASPVLLGPDLITDATRRDLQEKAALRCSAEQRRCPPVPSSAPLELRVLRE